MKIAHAALVCESEENSDRFYGHLLGLKRIGTKAVPADLMHRLFGVNVPFTILHYANDACHLEIFIGSGPPSRMAGVDHICLDVGKREPFLEKCRKLGVKILEVPKPDGSALIFINDFDGNRFEIKGD